MNSIPLSWHTSDELLNSSMAKAFNAVEESPFGLYIFGNRKWLVEAGEIVNGLPYQHVRRKLTMSNRDVRMVCGDKVRAYSITDIEPVVGIPDSSDRLMCKKCAVQLELTIWTA